MTSLLGVFGGSGFYEFLDDATEHVVDTPFGSPAAPVMVGAVGSILLAIGGRALSASRTRGMALTLGPAIAVAAGAALFVTTPLVHWYGSLIGSA